MMAHAAAHADGHLVVEDGAQHVQEVARVEANRDLGSVVLHRELVEALAALRALALDANLAARHRELHAAGAVAGGHRHGLERVGQRQARHARDPGPLQADCSCYTCRRFSRAYLRHLFVAGELLAFFWSHKWWWLTPMILMLLIVAALVVFAQSSAIAPFIYTLF